MTLGEVGALGGCNCLLFDKTKSSYLSEDTKLIKKCITQCDTIQKLLNLEENGDDDVNFFTHVNSKYYDMKHLYLPSSFGSC